MNTRVNGSSRLFVSLYVLVSASIIFVGWLLDSLWQHGEEDVRDQERLINNAFVGVVGQLDKPTRQKYFAQLSTELGVDYQLVALNSIAVDPSLLSADNLITAEVNQQQYSFLRIDDQVLQIGPYPSPAQQWSRSWFTLGFYLALALVIFAWVWPLARDLRKLKNATQALGEQKWQTKIELSKRSGVADLAATFNTMASHIGALLDNQKHLTNAVSHEIRTPLARLKFALAILEAQSVQLLPSVAEKVTELSGEMAGDIDEIEGLISEMLTYANVEVKSEQHRFEPCHLNSIAQAVLNKLPNNNSLNIELRVDTNTAVFADIRLTERAIQNIVSNASRYAQKQIILVISQNEQSVNLSVTDDGRGVASDEREKIFQPFYRANQDSGDGKGYGLGLAIVARIMKLHQGNIALDSQAGSTTFTLSWPLTK
ncbi:hypothetical protein J7384_03810 [Endozoicomonas sp. G2_1]|uniref:ATP-binding protein n=1 Tax=Endozoicomonas sp. G2_1 TaxID=2821091 RepID=UPI001ADC7E61|nr:ATP-binding protein [Endozoicomonas sp. G2_1]MBO9489482.1 hypothetical protein [Endozoicomonas sp. G2_1]